MIESVCLDAIGLLVNGCGHQPSYVILFAYIFFFFLGLITMFLINKLKRESKT